MDIKIPHTFIIAVSGGVDSMVLLHMIKHQSELLPSFLRDDPHIIVAHVDHGIRDNSSRDREFVQKMASLYEYEYDFTELKLGQDTSEEEARIKRYEFLDKLKDKYKADAVVTAHHSDDVVETAIINMTRGTGRRGLSSLKSKPGRCRPLLTLSKADVLSYAKENSVEWNEDETNADTKYLRNKVRQVLATADKEWKDSFATHLQKISQTNDLLDTQIATMLQYRVKNKLVLARSWFIKLDHAVASELMLAFLKKALVQNIDKKLVERLVIALKVGKPGTSIDVDGESCVMLTKRSLRLVDRKTRKTRIV